MSSLLSAFFAGVIATIFVEIGAMLLLFAYDKSKDEEER